MASVDLPVFGFSSVVVIFVLGVPGAGKVIQCARLVDNMFPSSIYFATAVLLEAGDLLRAEQLRQGSEYGDLIRTCIRGGTLVASWLMGSLTRWTKPSSLTKLFACLLSCCISPRRRKACSIAFWSAERPMGEKMTMTRASRSVSIPINVAQYRSSSTTKRLERSRRSIVPIRLKRFISLRAQLYVACFRGSFRMLLEPSPSLCTYLSTSLF